MRHLRSVPAMRPPGSPRTGVPGRLHREAAGERPPRARPQRRGSPGPIPNPAVKPAFAESTAARGCGRAGRRARGGRFSIYACASGAARAACAGRGSSFASGPIGVAAHTAPARHRGASRYRRGVVPCGPLRVLGHCPAGRSDRRRALGRRFFYLYEAPARFAGPGRVPAGGSPPVGLSVFRGRSLPEGLREGFLLDRSCARHVPEELRGLPAGLLALTWTSNLTAVDRFALSRHSAVSKRFCPGRPPLWCRRYVPRVSEVRGGICSFDLIMSMLLLACVVGSAIVAFGATLFGEHFR